MKRISTVKGKTTKLQKVDHEGMIDENAPYTTTSKTEKGPDLEKVDHTGSFGPRYRKK